MENRNANKPTEEIEEMLERNNGVSGMLDRELDGGRLFWFRDAVYNLDMSDTYM